MRRLALLAATFVTPLLACSDDPSTTPDAAPTATPAA